MSSKKINTTVGMDREVLARLENEKKQKGLSRSYIVETALRDRYKLPRGEKEVIANDK